MKLRLILINLSFIIFFIGLLITVGIGMKPGAIAVLVASALMLTAFVIQIIQSIRRNRLWSFENLLYTLAILIYAVIFIHGFSVSIDMLFLGNIPGFNSVYLVSGLLLISLFLAGSIRFAHSLESGKRGLLTAITTTVACTLILGLLGISGIIPVSGYLLTNSVIFLALFYLIFFVALLFSERKDKNAENWILTTLSGVMLVFIVFKFKFPQLMPQGLTHSIIYFGFVPALVLPFLVLHTKRFHVFTVFVFLFVSLDFYFIHLDINFNYLATVGVGGCVGYEDAATFPLNTDPGILIEELLKEPTEDELNAIQTAWKEKHFTPTRIEIEYEKELPNGDSLRVISHFINGQKHYGLIRIPKGINIFKAPILLGLMGGGTGIDVLKTSDINRLSSASCRELLDKYISIMPSFRGNIVRGEDFCFRSEGYAGDVWVGAAEDAVAFLEVVKFMYHKNDSVKTIAKGTSRGATVALIIGGLTDKLDYVIANSTHTKFLARHVLDSERVGGSYSRAFYTPKASPDEIRERLIASSPYYFTNNLPAFEIHQGTEDQKTTVWHARILETRLRETGRNDSTSRVYIYDGKGHAYDDDNVVCISLRRFLEN